MAKSSTMSQNVNAKADNEPKSAVDNLPAKSKGAKRKSKEDGLPLYQIQFDLVNWMSGGLLVDAQPFGEKFVSYYSDKKKKGFEIARITNSTVAVPSSNLELLETLTEAMKKFERGARQYCLPYKARKEVVEAYIAEKHAYRLSEPPATFCWESENKIAFNRVRDPIFAGEYGSSTLRQHAPLYCGFIDRCSLQLQTRQFLGSLLFPKSSHKQTLHLWGERDAGKTTFIKLLLECMFGIDGFEAIDVGDFFDDKYLFDDFVGKMAVMADEINDGFYSSNAYKRYTGGTKHRVQVKHKASYSANLTAKMIATSNDIPALPIDNAVLGRVILVRIENLKSDELITDIDDFKRRFLEEVPYILADIKGAYEQLEGKRIAIPADSYADSVEIGTAREQVFFDSYFELQKDAKSLAVSEFIRICTTFGDKDKRFYKRMREFVVSKYSCSFSEKGGPNYARFKVVTNIIARAKNLQGLIL